MPRNNHKAEYERSKTLRMETNETFASWWFTRRDARSLIKFINLTSRNDGAFEKAFGKALFTWCSSGGQKSWAWKFTIDEDLTVYVFSGTRGTSYEYSSSRPYHPDVGKKLISFVDEVISGKVKEAVVDA